MLRRFAFLFAFMLMARPLLSANVRVTDVTVQTHWPWNGLVDIIYSIESDNPCQLHQMTFHCHDRIMDRTVEMKSLSGTGVNFLVNAGGPYKVTWDAGKDAPEFRSASFVVDVMASVVDEPSYLMIDLSEGPAASSYPVKYTMQPPDASGDDCRTTELWLRHIPRGTFTMGSPGNSKVVTLTEDYYIGVFECTQRQYELVTGGNPSIYNEQGATRPVEMVTYNDLRGADTGSGWPGKGHDVDAGSFFGLLQAKTGLLLDLPTSAQWEYSCRAGTTTDLNSGENITNATPCPNLARLARYDATRHDGKPFHEHTRVGSYLPNAWGLYDCHGNVWEWCLDWSSEATSEAVSDPVGPSTGAFRVQRGGCWGDPYWKEAGWCTSSVQSDNYEDTATANGGASWDTFGSRFGFRIACAAPRQTYLVIDLSGGTTAANYPCRYSELPPDTSSDDCRTTELWLRRIPRGTFTMGSPESELGRRANETPHQVTLTNEYYIGVFECTQRQWELVMGDRPAYFENNDFYAIRPVESISYNSIRGGNWPENGHMVDTDTFMGRLQTKTGLTFDLPTEAQWERACRAGTATAFNSGKDIYSIRTDENMDKVGRYAWNGGNDGAPDSDLSNGTAKVGSYQPNAWGLYDCHGNVSEWCLDWHKQELGTSAVFDPAGPDSYANVTDRTVRVRKDGHWNSFAWFSRAAARTYEYPNRSNNTCGFRVACVREGTYLVIDLSGGTDAAHYPYRYTDNPPNLHDDTCRTSELWLRRIPKGTFMMGSPKNELGRYSYIEVETQHKVTLTRDYYVGVFECTQRQWELVMGTRPSFFGREDCYATRPVDFGVFYDNIRGFFILQDPASLNNNDMPSSVGWPVYGHTMTSDSFMGRLQSKTGLVLDLPTEAQWEYACRAGTTTSLNSGKNITVDSPWEKNCPNTDEVARNGYNSGYLSETVFYEYPENADTSQCTAKVGSYLPNAWGLYDFHGNVRELCLDWYQDDLGTDAVIDPVGKDAGNDRVSRGGAWNDSPDCLRSATRVDTRGWTYYDMNTGFRIACHSCENDMLSSPLPLDVCSADGLKIITGTVRFSPVANNADASATLAVDGKEAAGWSTASPDFDTTNLSDGWHDFQLTENGEVSTKRLLVLNGVTIHEGILESSETWDATTVHVVRNWVRVPNEVTLTIADGAIVKFCDDTGIMMDKKLSSYLFEDNATIALGDCILTNIADDAHGGDTNHDGSATSPNSDSYRLYLYGKNIFSGDPALFYAKPCTNSYYRELPLYSVTVDGCTVGHTGHFEDALVTVSPLGLEYPAQFYDISWSCSPDIVNFYDGGDGKVWFKMKRQDISITCTVRLKESLEGNDKWSILRLQSGWNLVTLSRPLTADGAQSFLELRPLAFDATNRCYIRCAEPSALKIGVGYWVFVVFPTNIVLQNDTTQTNWQTAGLRSGWNCIGVARDSVWQDNVKGFWQWQGRKFTPVTKDQLTEGRAYWVLP